MNDQLSGRELDVAVARRVMGWKHYQSDRGLRLIFFLSPEAYATNYIQSKHLVQVDSGNEENASRCSESIEAAMQVVDQMYARGWAVDLYRSVLVDDEWFAEFSNVDSGNCIARSAYSRSLPEAICKASLAALSAMEDKKS